MIKLCHTVNKFRQQRIYMMLNYVLIQATDLIKIKFTQQHTTQNKVHMK